MTAKHHVRATPGISPATLAGALEGKADLVDGKVPSAQIPAVNISETWPVASEAAMLALDADRGDVAVRSDFDPAQAYMLTADDPSVLDNWTQLGSAGSVLSVNGQSGAVTLTPVDIGAAAAADLAGKVGKGDLVVSVKDHGAVGDGVADDLAAFNAAITAAGTGTVFVPKGTYLLSASPTLTGKACSIRGAGEGTILRGVGDGPVLDFGGWISPGKSIGNFSLEGNNTAGKTGNIGIKLHQPNAQVAMKFHDIRISKTGGTGFDFGQAELADFERIVVTTPVGADVHDVPYFKGIGAFNGNRIVGCGILSLVNTANVGTSGAFVLTDNGTYTPTNNLVEGLWVQGLHPQTDQTMIAVAGNGIDIADTQFFDCSKVPGAAGTSYFRLNTPAVLNLGGNTIRGIIPGKDSGVATSPDMGVDLRQSRNRITGVKGYRGTNVVIAAGVTNCFVEIGGAFAAGLETTVVDNSASTSHVIIDHFLGDMRLSAPHVIRFGAAGPSVRSGTGSPEGSVSAYVGSQYWQTNGTSGAVLWVKETGQGNNTGWVRFESAARTVTTKTAAYTATAADSVILADATSAATTITLPTAVGVTGKTYTVKRVNTNGNAVTVGTTSGQTIDGATTYVLASPQASVEVVSDGANWRAVGRPAGTAEVVNVRDYGARGDGTTDDTAAIRAAAASVASGGLRLHFPAGNYVVSSVADGTPLLSFTGRDGVTIDGAEATITNPTSYTADTVTAMFSFNACKNVKVHLKEYVGFTLPTPGTHLGYRGASLVYLANACSGVEVKARITNARYGVLAGNYSNEALGYSRNLRIDLQTSFCGYPIALYLAENVRYEIDADDSHRPVYLAGCRDVKGTARWKDLWIAPYATLLTDAKTGTGTSRGCSDVEVASIDKGSTVFINNTSCAAIALSRVDPGIVYENIRVSVFTKSTDTISSRVGGFALVSSGAKELTTPVAPFGWEPSITLRNITVSGVVDHSAQTTNGNTIGDLFIRTWDTAGHAATVENLNVEDLIIKQSPGNTRQLFFEVPGLINSGASFRNFSAPDAVMIMVTNGTVPTKFTNSRLKELYLQHASNRVVLDNTRIDKLTEETPANALVEAVGSAVGGAGAYLRYKQLIVNLTGASVNLANFIPAGAVVFGLQSIINTEITGASGYQLGVSGDLTRYADVSNVAVGSTTGPANFAATEVTPRLYQAATALTVTAKSANFTAGQLRLVLSYLSFTTPTS